ncbi:MAG: DUF5695 domain-containing protein [Bacteroidales bacterium]|jgi:hypothetical protein|nr:DUF5695 domain-containing protein [Bacteroidales bacterium]
MSSHVKFFVFVFIFGGWGIPARSQSVFYHTNPSTGAINYMSIDNDYRAMNWLLETDGTQYPWIGQEYGWGLGFFSMDSVRYFWNQQTIFDTNNLIYKIKDILISIKRKLHNNELIEEYTFKNTGKRQIQLIDIGINAPFNDNYPDGITCMRSRGHAHVWDGEHGAYINVMHQSGQPPHLGLVLTRGVIKSYEIRERGINKGGSNTRGVIVLNPENITLKPQQSYTIAWRIFAHNGWSDFKTKMLRAGGIVVECPRYVYKVGDTATIVFATQRHKDSLRVPVKKMGKNRVEIRYGKGKHTHVDILGISNYSNLIKARADFIIRHQQMNEQTDPRHGAYMVYDNEDNRIFLNDRPTVSFADRDEGGERLGMGVFLALYYLKTRDEKVKTSLLRYADFVKNKLQDSTFRVFSTVDHQERNRTYNYPWVAEFYLRMFEVSGNKQFLHDAYRTLRSMFRQFGYGFYAIDGSIMLSQQLLRKNGLLAEADTLLSDYCKKGNIYLKNGIYYPKHEVNYEQSIVAPSVITLCQLYLLTGNREYLEGATLQMPLLETFGGQQPSYHLHDIAIRHWDGYWFGKRELWGDVMPHYWSTLTAVAFDIYARCTGNEEYRERAKNIVRNNLCLFSEDGRASCAYVYPTKVNDTDARCYDPFANDQDWALAYFLILNSKE